MKEIRDKLKALLSELDYYVNEGVVFNDDDLTDYEFILKDLERQIVTIKTFNTNKESNPIPILKKITEVEK